MIVRAHEAPAQPAEPGVTREVLGHAIRVELTTAKYFSRLPHHRQAVGRVFRPGISRGGAIRLDRQPCA